MYETIWFGILIGAVKFTMAATAIYGSLWALDRSGKIAFKESYEIMRTSALALALYHCVRLAVAGYIYASLAG